MKVLVTGGNGFLGSWLVKALSSRGDLVRVLHRQTSDMSALAGLSYESVLGDVTDLKSLKKAASEMEGIFHAAALIAYAPQDYEKMEMVNVHGTANIVEAALHAKVKRLVHTSSVVAIGATREKKLLDESSLYEMAPYHFGYYDTKHQAEEIIREAVRQRDLDAVIVNPGIMFGPGDAIKGTRKFHLQVAAGKFPFYPSGGVNVSAVEDAVTGHLSAYERGRRGERYILGGENILIKDMFRFLAEAGGHRAPFLPLPDSLLRAPYYFGKITNKFGVPFNFSSDSPFISTMYHWYDISKAKRELGYSHRPASAAMQKSVDWCFENGILKKPRILF